MDFRRSFFAALPFVALAAPVQAQDWRFEDFFKGRTYAYGGFSAINGERREFFITLDGRWDGTTLRLTERFEFTNGERDVKTWVFRKTGPNTYSGTREDVIGATTLSVSGNRATMAYDVNLTPKGQPNIVRFNDTLTLEADGSVRNTAWVTKFGLPVARAAVNFARTKAEAERLKP